MESVVILTTVAAVMAITIGCVSQISKGCYLNRIKDKTVGDGQFGTARFAYKSEVAKKFKHIKFDVKKWRQGLNLPKEQGIVLGCDGDKPNAKAIVDTDDVHTLMIGAAGVGKTAYFLYPNLEYACASGMSFISSDTKGDLARNYGTIARDYYGYDVSVIDLRNPTKSDGNNMLYLVNKYMDIYLDEPNNLAAKAKAEKYAKIIAKTIVGGDSQNHGQNAFFYDSAEGLLTATILLVAECFSPKNPNYDGQEKRHIVSIFKIIQELLAPAEGIYYRKKTRPNTSW